MTAANISLEAIQCTHRASATRPIEQKAVFGEIAYAFQRTVGANGWAGATLITIVVDEHGQICLRHLFRWEGQIQLDASEAWNNPIRETSQLHS